MTKKIKVGVVFGGQSAEHEVSLVSAASIMRAMDPSKYIILPFGITTQGEWVSEPKPIMRLREGKVRFTTRQPSDSLLGVDIVFPVLHGPFGEDGTIQGLFEMFDLPYVGAGVLASSLAMDKVAAKNVFAQHSLPLVNYLLITRAEWTQRADRIMEDIKEKIGCPCFVKPANMGSSVGISKVKNKEEQTKAINLAFRFDRRVIIEQAVRNAREIEVAILGNDELIVSVPGEIIPGAEFYNYYDKYVNGKADGLIPAPLTREKVEEFQQIAQAAYRAIDCAGMARVDFLMERESQNVYLSEINTIPGFTAISMFPKLMEACGVSYSRQIDRLIELGLERHREKKSLRSMLDLKSDWYKKDTADEG